MEVGIIMPKLWGWLYFLQTSGEVQVLVGGPKPHGICQFRTANPVVSGSSCQPYAIWHVNDLGNCVFASPAFCDVYTDNANYLHSLANTMGGSGYHWLLYWEVLCFLHLFSNVWTSALFLILHGPITVCQGPNSSTIVPYWIRRFLFYATMLLFLPLLCGLVPFASPVEWKDHFSSRPTAFYIKSKMNVVYLANTRTQGKRNRAGFRLYYKLNTLTQVIVDSVEMTMVVDSVEMGMVVDSVEMAMVSQAYDSVRPVF
ncbi:hypothetical protein CsSME_00002786 [Camellia sinensis var. sinensis]